MVFVAVWTSQEKNPISRQLRSLQSSPSASNDKVFMGSQSNKARCLFSLFDQGIILCCVLMDNIGKVKEFAILDFKISEMCLKVKTKPTVIIFFEDETATSLVSSFPDLFFFCLLFHPTVNWCTFWDCRLLWKQFLNFSWRLDRRLTSFINEERYPSGHTVCFQLSTNKAYRNSFRCKVLAGQA